MALKAPLLVPLEMIQDFQSEEQWFEIKVGEFFVQKRLPCAKNLDGRWLVEISTWKTWKQDLALYFHHQGHNSPAVLAFLQTSNSR